MSDHVVERRGYSYHLVNIGCMPTSDHFNVVMDMEDSVEELFPWLAAYLPGCTYVHGAGVINLMAEGHIVAIYPHRITITDVGGHEEAEQLCSLYRDKIAEVRAQKDTITPVYEKRVSLTVLDILRSLPGTNCGVCGSPTCMAFAAGVFRREGTVSACDPLKEDPEKYRALVHQLQISGYTTG